MTLTHSILPLELDSVLKDMRRATETGLHYPALLVALTLPEVCAGMQLPREQPVREKHYVAFVDRYTKPNNLGIDGQICYWLRGGLVHRGALSRHFKFKEWTHVVFTVPETKASVHALTLEIGDKRALALDLGLFCKAMDAAVRSWHSDHGNEPQVIENMQHVLRYCQFGLLPFFSGAPVVGSGP